MSFHEVRFPTNLSWGTAGGPGFKTLITETAGGAEERVSRWSDPRRRYNASYAIKTYADLYEVTQFYIARMGAAFGFRFKDWADFHSNPANGGFGAAQGARDQLIATGDASTTQFQITKTYTSGGISRIRRIIKPVLGTVRVWVAGVEQIANWSVDSTTGIITFNSAPALGADIEVSYNFDVPVRFAESIDVTLATDIENFGSGSIPSIELIEIVDPDAGYVGEMFYGGAYEVSSAADLVLSPGLGKLWVVNFTVASRSAILPDPTSLPTGPDLLVIHNGGANTFTLRDHLLASKGTIATNQQLGVSLTLNGSGTKVWLAA